MRLSLLILLLLLGCRLDAEDRPLLHPLFSDGAVLQRDRPLTVWGWCAPGATVALTVGDGQGGRQERIAQGDGQGCWRTTIGPYPSGSAHTLTAVCGDRRASASGVTMGEVWLCGGQSNMAMPVAKAAQAERILEEAERADIRLFTVPPCNAGHPQAWMPGQWRRSASATARTFSAVGLTFGLELHQALGVPVALISSNWGGTSAQAWTSAEALAGLPDQRPALAAQQRLVAASEAQTARTGRTYEQLITAWYRDHDPGTAAGWADADATTAEWTPVSLPGALPGRPAAGGICWLRRDVELTAAQAAQGASLLLAKPAGFDTAFVNGQAVGGGEVTWRSRVYPLAGGTLKPGRNRCAVRLLYSDGPAQWNGPAGQIQLRLGAAGSVPLAGAWRLRWSTGLADRPPLPLSDQRSQGPSALFNGMIAPLQPLTMAGVLWYQGEANAHAARAYRSLLPALIADWRAGFQQELPFLIVQLANYGSRGDEPRDAPWAELREAQALTAGTVPHTALVATIDIGEAGDIHPRDKRTVGHRLAQAALATVYGRAVEWSGPVLRSAERAGQAMRVSFDHAQGLATRDGRPVAGFAVAGSDRRFAWAEARIDGDAVVASAAAVPAPLAVRYAWDADPAGNLVNAAGLPAVPFRSDDWPSAGGAAAEAPAEP